MFEKHEGNALGRKITDLEVVLNFEHLNLNYGDWTAARWMTEGDVLFFYHTNRGHKKIRRLLKELRRGAGSTRQASSGDTVEILERNLELSTQVESCIFACAPIEGNATYYAKEETYHFNSRSFAPFSKVHVFEKPLHSSEFGLHFKIGQNTVTPLYKGSSQLRV